MALHGGLTVEFSDGQEAVSLRFAVTDKEEETLRRFAQTAEDLIAALGRAGGLPAQFNLSYSQADGLQITTEEPSDDQRAVILHRLRPLILSREPWSFDRVCGIVRKSSNHVFLSRHLRSLRDIYSGAHIREIAVISRGSLVLNSDTAFQHWLNGFEYHQEQARATEIANASSLLPLEAVRPIFMMLLNEKVKAISLLAHLVGKMLEQPTPDSATG